MTGSEHPESVHVALVQLHPLDGDKERNLAAAGVAVSAAARAGARLVVLPEYALTGFPAERMRELAEPLEGPSLEAFRRLAGEAGVCLVAGLPRLGEGGEEAVSGGGPPRPPGGPPEPHGRPPATGDRPPIFDTTVVVAPDGALLTVYDKTHLFDCERSVFAPGAALQPPFTWLGVRWGVLCCFDIEFPEPARTLALRGAQCLLVPSANMKPWGPSHRAFVRARAIENQCWVAYANVIGPASGYEFEGESCLVDPFGHVLCDAERGESVVGGDVVLRVADDARAVGDYLAQRRPELYD